MDKSGINFCNVTVKEEMIDETEVPCIDFCSVTVKEEMTDETVAPCINFCSIAVKEEIIDETEVPCGLIQVKQEEEPFVPDYGSNAVEVLREMNPNLCYGCVITQSNVVEVLGTDEMNYLQFLQRHGVLSTSMICPNANCKQLCKIVLNPPRFRCQRQKRVNGILEKCRFTQSLKTNSWLSKAKLSIKKVVLFVTIWLTLPHPRHEYFKRVLNMSPETIVDWSNFCREICIASIESLDVDIIGGPGTTVEIDEAKVGKRKNNRGRVVEGSWIFGAFERGAKKCFFEKVQDRSSNCLMGVILRRIAPGTTIVTDLWRGSQPLLNHEQYRDLAVNHSLNFVDPNTSVHTQNIEEMWREVHSDAPRFGRNRNRDEGYLAEFYWKLQNDFDDRVHLFFQEVARQFNVNGNR